ncbi:MAG: hypothetical protein O3A37_04975 [Planctomycetota bacterium]|nr:hypothetical protein [Planctomycetota bacterium]
MTSNTTSFNLQINAGTGGVGTGGEVLVNRLSGAIGGTTPLTAVTLINARDTNIGRAVNAGTLSLLDATENIVVQGVMNLSAGPGGRR